MKRYHFLDERKFRYFCQGLTLDAQDMATLAKVLCSLDKVRKLPSKIVALNGKHGFGAPPNFPGPQIIISLEKTFSRSGGPTSVSSVSEHSNILNAAPGLHIHLRSPTLEIPQRIEIPLRYVLKGLPDIEGTHMIYLHTLAVREGPPFVYYGITKRGWMKRFNEHMAGALKRESRLMFHKTLRKAILGRLVELGSATGELNGGTPPTMALAGNHHVVCAAGLNEEQALEAEEYLVGKYSFGHERGLNMIPGGKAGVAHLHRLNVLSPNRRGILDEDREEAMDQYLRDHPSKGNPKSAGGRAVEGRRLRQSHHLRRGAPSVDQSGDRDPQGRGTRILRRELLPGRQSPERRSGAARDRRKDLSENPLTCGGHLLLQQQFHSDNVHGLPDPVMAEEATWQAGAGDGSHARSRGIFRA